MRRNSLLERKRLLLAACLMIGSTDAWAGAADVVGVTVSLSDNGTFRFDVTIRSDDTGWDAYADAWRVESPKGQVLGTRELLHPHETEQPFTRSLDGVAVPDDISEVVIRAHHKTKGWDGQTLTLPIRKRP